MNKKLIGLLVPVLGGAAIVGSGFSAWHFSDAQLQKSLDVTGNGSVTEIATIREGQLTLGTETLTVTLDQKSVVGATDYLEKGIIIDEKDNFNFTFTPTVEFADDNTANAWGYTKYVASVKFADTDTIASYVDVAIVSGTDKVASVDIPLTTTSVTYGLDLSWKDNKPTSYADYITMLNTLKGTTEFTSETAMDGLDSFTFTITVEVKAVK